jgi:hypothetical protein
MPITVYWFMCDRESYEEVGLPREHVQVLGALGGAISRARLMVVPVVAIIPTPGSPLFPHRPSPGQLILRNFT